LADQEDAKIQNEKKETQRKAAIEADPSISRSREVLAHCLARADESETAQLQQVEAYLSEGLANDANAILDSVLLDQIDRLQSKSMERDQSASEAMISKSETDEALLIANHNRQQLETNE
jgi:hypothetical protein